MKLWKDENQAYDEAINYIKNRHTGIETSIKTPWPKFNNALLDGFEWNTLTVIAARPATGKTMLKDQIITEAFLLNPNENFRVLELQFEMAAKASAVRHFVSKTKKSYKEILSAEGNKLNDNDFIKFENIKNERIKHNIDYIDTPLTIQQIKDQIDLYFETYKTKTIITLDHTLLVKKKANQNTLDKLYELGEFFTEYKKKYPCLFIALSQLNRNSEDPKRAENYSYGNYITGDDIAGADAMMQHADNLIGINRPAMKKITRYGPEGFIIDDDAILAFHFLKMRNGDPRISFFKGVFNEMKIIEIATPISEKRFSTRT